MIDSEDIIGGSEICDYTEQEAHNEQQGGLSVNASTQPISGHDTDYTKLEPTHHVKVSVTNSSLFINLAVTISFNLSLL